MAARLLQSVACAVVSRAPSYGAVPLSAVPFFRDDRFFGGAAARQSSVADAESPLRAASVYAPKRPLCECDRVAYAEEFSSEISAFTSLVKLPTSSVENASTSEIESVTVASRADGNIYCS